MVSKRFCLRVLAAIIISACIPAPLAADDLDTLRQALTAHHAHATRVKSLWLTGTEELHNHPPDKQIDAATFEKSVLELANHFENGNREISQAEAMRAARLSQTRSLGESIGVRRFEATMANGLWKVVYQHVSYKRRETPTEPWDTKGRMIDQTFGRGHSLWYRYEAPRPGGSPGSLSLLTQRPGADGFLDMGTFETFSLDGVHHGVRCGTMPLEILEQKFPQAKVLQSDEETLVIECLYEKLYRVETIAFLPKKGYLLSSLEQARRLPDGQKINLRSFQFDDFVEQEGVWFPRGSIMTQWRTHLGSARLKETTTRRVEDLRLNQPVADADLDMVVKSPVSVSAPDSPTLEKALSLPRFYSKGITFSELDGSSSLVPQSLGDSLTEKFKGIFGEN